MEYTLLIGLLLGWGAAVPIGPINIEIVRRNLRFGSRFGISFGLGACFADLTFLGLLSLGALAILTYPSTLKIVGVLGALVLAWFGIKALQLKEEFSISNNAQQFVETQSIDKHWLQGYLMTLLNPFTIIFWSSISAQVAILTHKGTGSALYAGIGVLLGVTSWVIGLNALLHITRHKFSNKMIHRFNITGGVILLIFAVLALIYALY